MSDLIIRRTEDTSTGCIWREGWGRKWTEVKTMKACHSVVSDFLRPPGTVAHQAPLPMGFSRQECWSGLPFPPPEKTMKTYSKEYKRSDSIYMTF